MNTEFFRNASDITKNFNWKDIFADTFKQHTKEQTSRQMSRGMRGNVPAPSAMLQQWQKPWLFVRAAAIAIVLTVLTMFAVQFLGSISSIAFLYVIPAFAIPLAVVVFYWEMNIPGDISILEAVCVMLLGGILSLCVNALIRQIGDWPSAAYIAGPWPEEIAKFLIVYLILTRGKYRYGIQGILIGGAVGAGFAAIETSGYAMESAMKYAIISYEEVASQYSVDLESALNAAYNGIIQSNMMQTQLLRGLLAIGGHTVWAAFYGGAIALAKKGQEKLKVTDALNPLTLMSLATAILLHTFWNMEMEDLLYILPDGLVVFLYNLKQLFVYNVVLIILAWIFLLFIMRKCIRQIVAASPVEPGEKREKGAAAAQVVHHERANAKRGASDGDSDRNSECREKI
ncbi:MAG: PrsW family glutamic-type intramembrane protease [Lachnospiraceae bacterium]|nr:PrsW family glutamic-type intramembrane protease [Lachnospiraceae bacterium]